MLKKFKRFFEKAFKIRRGFEASFEYLKKLWILLKILLFNFCLLPLIWTIFWNHALNYSLRASEWAFLNRKTGGAEFLMPYRDKRKMDEKLFSVTTSHSKLCTGTCEESYKENNNECFLTLRKFKASFRINVRHVFLLGVSTTIIRCQLILKKRFDHEFHD